MFARSSYAGVRSPLFSLDKRLTWTSANSRVLLVEDEPALREAIANTLRNTGIAVLEASDGWSALEIIRDASRDVDVILLDLNIPGNPSENVLAEAEKLRQLQGFC